jgi:parvulin-like peptidyl-prolyl isomerase
MKFYPFLFLVLLGASAEARLVDKTLSLVNSDLILNSDLDNFRKSFSLRRELDPFIAMTNFSGDSQKDILNYLIQEKLILQKNPPSVEEVEEEINGIQKNNKINRDQLREVLSSQGVDFDRYQQLMTVSVSKRKLIDRELRPLAAVSDEEVKNHYYTDAAYLSRRSQQKLVLTYSFQQLILPDSGTAEEASRRLRAGDDFDSIAASLAARGAESTKLSSLSEENLNSQIKQAIQGMKVGESTKPLASGSGYLILKITGIGAPKDPAFEAEKEKIRGTLFQKALVNQLKNWTERERAASYIHISAN